MATKTNDIETAAVETEAVAEATTEAFRKQYSTVLFDQELTEDLATLSALKQHSNPSELVRAALTSYRDTNAGRIARFREFIDSDDQ